MRYAPLVILLGVIVACTPTRTVYFAEGVTHSERDTDIAQCQAAAFTTYPVRTITRVTPVHFIPGTRHCNTQGDCLIRPGYFVGGDPYMVDVNQSQRRAEARA